MVTLKEELWSILQHLKENEFKQFKWLLEAEDIPVCRLENADRTDTVDLMVQQHQGPGALELTTKILEKISRNDLMEVLVQTRSRWKELNNREKAKLAKTKADINLMIQERQKRIGDISRSSEISSQSAERHIADSRRVFAVLKQSVETSLDNLIEDIEKKRDTSRKEAEGFIRELEKEISELTKRCAEVETLSRTEDHHDFLHSVPPLHGIPFTKSWKEICVTPPLYGRSVEKSINELEDLLKKEKVKLIVKVQLRRVQQFAKDVTLDPDTANPRLVLSEDGKTVHCGDVKKNLPDNPDRFNTAANVLGKQSFSSGRFYYEVLVKGKSSWDLGVVKGSIDRKGSIFASPQNGYWTICLREGYKYKASAVNLSVKRQPERVGVFVDYEKHSVFFYDVDSADVIHKFTHCSFTEKLFPFFSPSPHYNCTNSAPLIILPVDYSE
ncbi:E3 ubiquitin-protein ligase TRIM68-like [Eleginops maclovinus]|uniref:E3 ubiquitin-protein ligase TRIM68-like n=1 Tax=Eleginops maclovinus TaxID=56733 RepID=UPI0030809AC4